MEDIDPNILLEKFHIFYEKAFKSKGDCVEVKMMLDKFLGIKAKNRKYNNSLCSKCYF